MAKKKCRLCPYAAVCPNTCYDTDGLTPCDHALKYDALEKRMKQKDLHILDLEKRLRAERESKDAPCIIYGDYVLTAHRNAFNDKTSWWISKKGYTVAWYCFTADTATEVERQLQSVDCYIKMLEEGLK